MKQLHDSGGEQAPVWPSRLGATLFFQRVFTVEPDNVVLNTAIQLLTPIVAGFNSRPCVHLEDTIFNDLDELLHLIFPISSAG